uniref:Uncharacterized protein n=1 Tax=Strongyloides venezuelensis TaxID=75913 RepID=A0A0K0G5T9_STRVS
MQYIKKNNKLVFLQNDKYFEIFCLYIKLNIITQTPIRNSRKRHSNDFNSIIEQSPIKRLNSVTETFNDSSSLTFVDKILETINEKPKITFADVVSKNISKNKDITNSKDKFKNNFKQNPKNKNNLKFKNNISKHDNSLNKPKERKPLKDMSFEERYKLFENAKGPLFRFEITKKTPLLEANIFLADKLKDLNKIWLKDKIDEKESMKTWQKANKILRTIHRVLKSYHY